MRVTGGNLWQATAPGLERMPVLTGAVQADLAIVGGGYTGLSAALTAAEAGARVVVVEGARIGAGASGRNVGLVNAGLWLMPDDMDARLGATNPLFAALSQAPAAVWARIERHAIACEAAPCGTLHCAPDSAGLAALQTRAAQWQARQVPVRLLDAGETAARTGAAGLTGALFDPRAGTVQPLAYAQGLARAALAAGAQLFEESPVMAARQAGGHWQLDLPQGRLDAERVIWAGNAYAHGPAGRPAKALTILPYFNFATDPLPAALRAQILPGGEGAWDTALVLTSWRLDAAGRFIIGSVGALGTRAERAAHAAWAGRRMAELYPALKGVPFTHGWDGKIGTTPDAVPRLWQRGPGAFGVLGFNGRGIAPGTVMGAILAEAALGRGPLPDLAAPAPDALRGPRALARRAGAALWHMVSGR